MNIDNICTKSIGMDVIIRIFSTIICFYFVHKYYSNNNYIYLLLPVLLTILDFTDNTVQYISSKKYNVSKDQCIHTFLYQSLDKITDILSYILVWYLFDKSHNILMLIIIRIIGVIFFISCKKSFYLILFPDLIKEYMLCKYFNMDKNFPYIIIFKIIFEFYYHTYKNLPVY